MSSNPTGDEVVVEILEAEEDVSMVGVVMEEEAIIIKENRTQSILIVI